MQDFVHQPYDFNRIWCNFNLRYIGTSEPHLQQSNHTVANDTNGPKTHCSLRLSSEVCKRVSEIWMLALDGCSYLEMHV